MIKYQIGDVIIFWSMPDSQWLVVEIEERTYKFIDLWNHERVWISQKRAPVHNSIMKHYRGGFEVKDGS